MQGSKSLKLINGRTNGSGNVMKYRTASQLPVLSCDYGSFNYPVKIDPMLAMKDFQTKATEKYLVS